MLGLFKKARRTDYVLVVGSAHIDVIADYEAAHEGRKDKIGSVKYSIGGTAYNIAVNLGQHSIPVVLLTVLKKNSFSSVWIRERLTSSHVDVSEIELSNAVGESGFVAIRREHDLETAVTSTAITSHLLSQEKLKRAVQNARFVVTDCNLLGDQIQSVLSACRQKPCPLVVAATSDSKVGRILELEEGTVLDLVALNEFELVTALAGNPARSDPSAVSDICRKLRAKKIVVTRGDQGYELLSADGARSIYAAPQVERIVSLSGAGDALLSGVLSYWYQHQDLDVGAASNLVAQYVRAVLAEEGATRGALASEADFAKLASIALQGASWRERLFRNEVGVAAGVISAILTLLSLAVAIYFGVVQLQAPSKPPAQNIAPAVSP